VRGRAAGLSYFTREVHHLSTSASSTIGHACIAWPREREREREGEREDAFPRLGAGGRDIVIEQSLVIETAGLAFLPFLPLVAHVFHIAQLAGFGRVTRDTCLNYDNVSPVYFSFPTLSSTHKTITCGATASHERSRNGSLVFRQNTLHDHAFSRRNCVSILAPTVDNARIADGDFPFFVPLSCLSI